MEFKNIDDKDKSSYQKYLDLLYDVNGSTDKLALLEYKNSLYVISNGVDAVGIVENDGDELKPFFVNIDDPIFQVFGTCELIYNVVDSFMKEVIKTDGLKTFETRVSYLPAIDNYPRDVLEYSQYIGAINATLDLRYDVTMRKTVESSLAYTYYQLPDDIRFQYLKRFWCFDYNKTTYYGRSLDQDDQFYSPRLVIRDYPIGQKRKIFDGHALMDQFEQNGFQKRIPNELATIINGTNEEFKTLKLISSEYKKHIKGQN